LRLGDLQAKNHKQTRHVREIEVTVYGWKAIVLIDVPRKIPLVVTVVLIHEHEVLSMRALVT
jgi:hypothetical protein